MKMFSETINSFTGTKEDPLVAQKEKISIIWPQPERNYTKFTYYPWEGKEHFKVFLAYSQDMRLGYYSLIPVFHFGGTLVEPEMFDAEGLANAAYRNISLNEFLELVILCCNHAKIDTFASEAYPGNPDIQDAVIHFGGYTIRRTYYDDQVDIVSTYQDETKEKRENVGIASSASITIKPRINQKGGLGDLSIKKVVEGNVYYLTRAAYRI